MSSACASTSSFRKDPRRVDLTIAAHRAGCQLRVQQAFLVMPLSVRLCEIRRQRAAIRHFLGTVPVGEIRSASAVIPRINLRGC